MNRKPPHRATPQKPEETPAVDEAAEQEHSHGDGGGQDAEQPAAAPLAGAFCLLRGCAPHQMQPLPRIPLSIPGSTR